MRRFVAVLAVWTIVAVLFAGQLAIDSAYTGHRVTPRGALALAFTGWYAWALLYPLVAWLARWFRPTGRGVAVHAALSIVVTLVKIIAVSEILRAFGTPQRSISMLVNVPVNLAAYWLIVGVTWAIDANLRSSKLEASLAATRLDLLRNQIQPHFLFNTLHGIAELMHEDVDAADRMVTRLSELLRATIETGGKQEISLRDELALLDRYIEIQRMRLGDRLRFTADVEPRSLDRAVPMLLLQPLVENAVRHAIANRRDGGSISVKVGEASDRLSIEIADDGPGFSTSPSNGVGLANVRDRLEHLYGNRQSMQLASAPNGGALVRIAVPLRTHGSGPHADR